MVAGQILYIIGTIFFIMNFGFSESLTLKDRINFLTRAVMCMRSDRIGYVPEYGMFLRELEDKLEIAKVQEHILQALTTTHTTTNLNKDEAIKALNAKLFDVTHVSCGDLIIGFR